MTPFYTIPFARSYSTPKRAAGKKQSSRDASAGPLSSVLKMILAAAPSETQTRQNWMAVGLVEPETHSLKLGGLEA